jgi:hypothetical protein
VKKDKELSRATYCQGGADRTLVWQSLCPAWREKGNEKIEFSRATYCQGGADRTLPGQSLCPA